MNSIAAYGLTAALLCLVVVAAYAKALDARLDASRAVNAALTQSVSALQMQANQAALARDVEEARAKRQAMMAADARAAVETILTADMGDCADAPLDPSIRDVLDGLRLERIPHRVPSRADTERNADTLSGQ